MQDIVKEYGPALISVCVIISLVALIRILIGDSASSVVGNAFSSLISNFFSSAMP